MIGSTVGKYRIIEQLGRGGMGTVYKAIDETLDREVAIKALNADLLTDEAMQRFRGEAVMLAKLSHPRIASIYELTRQDKDLLMVMEYVKGETCEKLMARTGAMPVGKAVVLCDQILDALEHAHASGIVHRTASFGEGPDVSEMVVDRLYEGWDGRATLEYPDELRTVITADGALDKLQIYSAWDYPYVCVEPVSNANDGFNRMAAGVPSHGVRVLEPNRSIEGSIRFFTE